MTIRILLLLAFLLEAGFGFGQFAKEEIIFGHIPINIYSSDLNGDESVDVITVMHQSNEMLTVYWQENDGNGKFSLPKKVIQDIDDDMVLPIDFDDDGDQDIVCIFRNHIIWLANNGQGGFSAPINIISVVSGVSDFVFGDIDGDGDKDLLIANPNDNSKLFWYENTGNNIYRRKRTIDTIEHFQIVRKSIQFIDLDNDGDLDIIPLVDASDFLWYNNDGTGVFTDSYISDNDLIEGFFIKDLDEDDNADILVLNRQGIVRFEYEGNSNFSEQVLIDKAEDFGNSTEELVSFDIADINNDGYLDLVMASNSQGGKIYWSENEGNQNFLAPITIHDNSQIEHIVRDRFTKIFTQDIDNDGRMDIVSSARSSGKVRWHKNFSQGRLFVKRYLFDVDQLYLEQFFHFKDMDQDGDKDILSNFAQLDRIVWHENQGIWAFLERNVVTAAAFGIRRVGVNIEDLDGDGDLDVFSASVDGNRVEWYRNNGNGDFSSKILAARNIKDALYVYAHDLDGDNDLDIICVGDDGSTLLKNDGQGNFSRQAIIIEATSIIDFEDIDQDGDIDIYRHSNAWYNDGLGNFSEKAVLFSNRWLEKSEAIDLDQDSDIDFIGYESDVVTWYEKKDGEDYEEQHIFDIPERYEYKSSQTGDIDQDGDIDLLVSISRQGFPNGHNVIYFLENDGNNNFIGKAIYEEEVTAWIDVYLDDLDQDGDLDMLTTSISGGGNNLFFHENLINTPIIQGVSFFDRNDNGIFDSTEMTIDNLPIILTPNVLSSYTDANGTYRFYVPNGTYTLTVQPDSCYQLTTDSLSYMVTIDGDVALNKNFGFQLASDYQHTQTRINSAATRCGFDVPFTISVQNDGCVPSKGQYGLVLDSLVTLIETAIEPNEIRGDTLLWNYEELFSTQSESIKLTLQIAGTEFLGDFIQLTGLSYIENEAGELKLSSTYDYTSEIRCAYDPNDKLVYPNRLGDYDKNYILFEEELEYTVRFQNTGTDTAFTVVIKDYLDPNLNWKTFKPVVSSHPHETLLHPDGLVEFTFKNILLPDSTTNEPLSHGFVTYKIQPNADLDENTNIENTANIFFDFNPPIQTNTTSNVLVEELPKTTSTRRVTKADFPIKIYPNPFEEVLTFELEQFQPAVLEIFDARGRLVRTASLQSRVHQESVSNLASGFYFYRLLTSGNYQLLTSGKVVKR